MKNVDNLMLLNDFEATLESRSEFVVLESDDETDLAGRRIDRLLTVRLNHQVIRLAVEVASHGYPRDLRQAEDMLLAIRVEIPEVIPMVIAPSLSFGSRYRLKQLDIGYWDTGGSFHLKTPFAFIDIDRPVPAGVRRRLRDVFHGSTAQVLHAMLLDPDRDWHISELATRALVAQSTVHQVFTYLEEKDLLVKRGRGPKTVRVLTNPGALLDEWANEHQLSDYAIQRFHVWSRQQTELDLRVASAMDSENIEYALTLESGGLMVAPYLTGHSKTAVLVHESAKLSDALATAELEPVSEGENVMILMTREQFPFLSRQRVNDVWVASSVQLYLDLWSSPQRGQALARNIRRLRLPY